LYITGKNAISEALSKSLVEVVYIKMPLNDREKYIVSMAKNHDIKIVSLEKNDMTSITGQSASVVAKVKESASFGIEEIVENAFKKHKNPLIFLLDGITDVHNLGAIIRNAYFFDVSGIILPKDHSAPMNEKVYEISSGAAYHIKIATVTNLNRAIEYLRERDFWIYYASEKGDTNLDTFLFDKPIAVILGNEHSGVRKIIKDNADGSVYIKSINGFDSLNVSSASAVIAYAYSTKTSH